ncbi:MAG: peptide MFS transporter [Bacteroidota bacterium]
MLNIQKHPKSLYVLFFAEMWERFSFYGMKALLMVYMVTQLKYDDEKSNLILGSYLALVYALPILGGMMADKFLGYRKAVIFGGLVMVLGHFVLAIPSESSFYFGLGCIIIGNGFFKPNISSMVGKLYKEGDPDRDAGFTIFYMGINIGAALGGLICGIVGQKYSWHLGFGLAGIFMILGLIVFVYFQDMLGEVGLPTDPDFNKKKSLPILRNEHVIYLVSILLIPIFVLLIQHNSIMDYIMSGLSILSLVYLIYIMFTSGREAGLKLLAATIMIISSVFFWSFYEQGGGALNLYALRNVNMHVLGMDLPSTAVNNFINPAFIVLFGFVFTWLWKELSKRNLEPSTPLKFGLGLIQLGIGFYVFVIGGQMAGEAGLVSLAYFALGYLFLSTGELCLSPIGLSMVTKLSPLKIVGFVMGVWFLASGLGQYFAGIIGTKMAIPTLEGVATISKAASLKIYSDTFLKITYFTVGTGLFFSLCSPIIKKWMGDVK